MPRHRGVGSRWPGRGPDRDGLQLFIGRLTLNDLILSAAAAQATHLVIVLDALLPTYACPAPFTITIFEETRRHTL